MRGLSTAVFAMLILTSIARAADQRLQTQTCTVELLDGASIQGRLALQTQTHVIVYSPRMTTLQSLPKNHIHKLTIGERSEQINPRSAGESHSDNGTAHIKWPCEQASGTNPAYVTEKWKPPQRLLIWSNPGRSAQPGDPGNWLENGAPATEPPDENTDLLVLKTDNPGDRPSRRIDLGKRLVCRHLTVAANTNAYVHTISVHGNLWLQGRCMMISCMQQGSKHTFMRNDGPQRRFTVYYTQAKPGAGVELIGGWETQDEVRIFDGDLVLAPDCTFEPGRNSRPIVDKNARLILLDGAYFGKWLNDMHSLDMELKGTIQGGTPDRPLARDCTLGLSFKNWANVELGQSTEFAADKRKSTAVQRLLARKATMVVHPGGQIRTYCKAGTNATLTIRWHGLNLGDWRGGNSGYLDQTKLLAELSQRHGRTIPPKITIYFDSGAMIDGVRFDNVHKAGILYKDADTRATWRNISYGDQNSAKPGELFKHCPDGIDMRQGTY